MEVWQTSNSQRLILGEEKKEEEKLEMWCMWLAGNAGLKKIAKNAASGHHRTTLSDDIFATKACIDNPKKKLVNQQYLLYMS